MTIVDKKKQGEKIKKKGAKDPPLFLFFFFLSFFLDGARNVMF